MATLISDEKDSARGGMVVGGIEFLPANAKVPPAIRSISRLMIERRAAGSESAQPAMIGKIMPDPVPNLRTSAPCERCADKDRLGHSHLCAGCIADKARANRNFLDREVSPRDFLMMCLLVGLLIFCIARFDAPEAKAPIGRKVQVQEQGKF